MIVRKLLLATVLAATLATAASAAPGDAVCPALGNLAETDPGRAHLDGTLVGRDGFMFTPGSDFRPLADRNVEPIKRLGEALGERGTKLVHVVLPDRILVYPDAVSAETLEHFEYDIAKSEKDYFDVLAQLNAAGIIAPDLLTALRTEAKEHLVYFKRDGHWTSYGARAVARQRR